MAASKPPRFLLGAGAVEGYEMRYMVRSEKYRRGGLIVRGPKTCVAAEVPVAEGKG